MGYSSQKYPLQTLGQVKRQTNKKTEDMYSGIRISEESRRVQQVKCCKYNNKGEDDNTYHVDKVIVIYLSK